MTIQSIRYWQNTSNDNAAQKDIQDKLRSVQQSFNSTLFDSLTGAKQNNLFTGSLFGQQNNILSGASSLEEISEELKNVKDMGMQKVLAAQLQAPLPFSEQFQNKSSSNDFSGLGMIAELTVQMQMIKAGESLNRFSHSSTMNLQQFIKSFEDEDSNNDSQGASIQVSKKIRYYT